MVEGPGRSEVLYQPGHRNRRRHVPHLVGQPCIRYLLWPSSRTHRPRATLLPSPGWRAARVDYRRPGPRNPRCSDLSGTKRGDRPVPVGRTSLARGPDGAGAGGETRDDADGWPDEVWPVRPQEQRYGCDRPPRHPGVVAVSAAYAMTLPRCWRWMGSKVPPQVINRSAGWSSAPKTASVGNASFEYWAT